jgi:hypothetical protein
MKGIWGNWGHTHHASGKNLDRNLSRDHSSTRASPTSWYNIIMDNYYGGIIWTNHALARLRERGLTQGEALITLKHPQRTRYAQSQQAWVYNRSFNHNEIEVVASQNYAHEWVVMSVWSRNGYRNNHRYLVRNGLVDWILDLLVKLFSKKKP